MGNCFGSNENDRKLLFTICAVLNKNEEDCKLFLIISAKLKIKEKRNGKEWYEIIGALYVDG